MKSRIYIIGCGGVGSWLTPALALLTSPQQITLIDMDVLEEKNLDRQLFKPDDIGRSKAEALAERYQCNSMHDWFADGLLEFEESDWLVVCVDNHRARKAALAECDRYGCQAIFAANETHSAEAYFYSREFKSTAVDPRTYFPDILTDASGDPQARSAGCTGEAQKENRQLVTSNSLAASLAGHLFALWYLHAPTVKKPKVLHSFPYRLVANRTRMETFLIKDRINQPEKGQNNERPNNGVSGESSRSSSPNNGGSDSALAVAGGSHAQES